MKLLIAVPAYESVRVEFFRSILELEKNLRENGVWYEIKPISGTLVHIARDRLASHAIKSAIYDYAQKHGKTYAALEGFDPDAEEEEHAEM